MKLVELPLILRCYVSAPSDRAVRGGSYAELPGIVRSRFYCAVDAITRIVPASVRLVRNAR